METLSPIKKELKTSFLSIRTRTEEICAPLKVEDYVPQASEFASPPKWHLAHTSWFFEEMILKKAMPEYEEYHSNFGFLFNSYYQSIGERTVRAERGLITRPTVQEVYAYREHIDKSIIRLLESGISAEIEEIIEIGLQHEQQHQELLITDLKFLLGQNPIYPVYKEGVDLTSAVNEEEGWLHMAEGIYEIGHEGEGFSFDNEHGRHKVFLHHYSLSKSLVTNGEFIEFIEAGGYEQFQYWLDEGWSWRSEHQVSAPMYWIKENGRWFHFTLEGLKPVVQDQVLTHISFYEANAYATWKGMRLPTEFEWEAAADHFSWGKRWEWTNSAYLPYPNFKIAEGALGEYNGKFMINQMVLRGASTATSPNHSRKTYRNFFHPNLKWQFTGIRLCK